MNAPQQPLLGLLLGPGAGLRSAQSNALSEQASLQESPLGPPQASVQDEYCAEHDEPGATQSISCATQVLSQE